MARKLSNGKYEPGVIYRLYFIEGTERIPFYVGESIQPDVRLAQHKRGGELNADSEDRNVYAAIQQMNDAGVTWDMEIVEHYGEDGPSDLEDVWVLKTLYDQFTLTNMKRGNQQWLERMEADAQEMRKLGISSPREYRARKKAELMTPDVVIESDYMAALARATGRRKDTPEMLKLRKKTANWSAVKVLAQMNNLRMDRHKYGETTWSNLYGRLETIYTEKCEG